MKIKIEAETETEIEIETEVGKRHEAERRDIRMVEGKILKVSGPLVVAEGMRQANMFDVVHVGRDRLIGEIDTGKTV